MRKSDRRNGRSVSASERTQNRTRKGCPLSFAQVSSTSKTSRRSSVWNSFHVSAGWWVETTARPPGRSTRCISASRVSQSRR